jgi:hypothetical protein
MWKVPSMTTVRLLLLLNVGLSLLCLVLASRLKGPQAPPSTVAQVLVRLEEKGLALRAIPSTPAVGIQAGCYLSREPQIQDQLRLLRRGEDPDAWRGVVAVEVKAGGLDLHGDPDLLRQVQDALAGP